MNTKINKTMICWNAEDICGSRYGRHRFRHIHLLLFMFIDFISLFPNWLPMSAE
jgi:hypothetical protein